MTDNSVQLALAIIRQAGSILLVKQLSEETGLIVSTVPGGLVEDHELITEALIREVREETGLIVSTIGSLAYVSEIEIPKRGFQALAFAFEISGWSGVPQTADPEEEILEVSFVPLEEALLRLRMIAWPGMREPLIGYLSGQAPPGALWVYRQEKSYKDQRLVHRVPGLAG